MTPAAKATPPHTPGYGLAGLTEAKVEAAMNAAFRAAFARHFKAAAP